MRYNHLHTTPNTMRLPFGHWYCTCLYTTQSALQSKFKWFHLAPLPRNGEYKMKCDSTTQCSVHLAVLFLHAPPRTSRGEVAERALVSFHPAVQWTGAAPAARHAALGMCRATWIRLCYAGHASATRATREVVCPRLCSSRQISASTRSWAALA